MLYILRGDIYREKGNDNEMVSIYREFRNENLILARKECFSSYQSYIDVFLQGIGKKYISHKRAEIDLRNFIFSNKKTTKLGLPYIENGIGISISFVFDDTIVYQNNNVTIYKEEISIHGLENESGNDLKSIYLKNLEFELEFYKENNFEIKEEINELVNIIKTPIDYKRVLIAKHL
ncbi:hypothetical protein [Tenacibaculum haliotis]|uniref:hypothetical protein n=1 Tax=Tenacibaculum haliotis TaxID=1888914 RepID=UPI0021AFD9B5|nr:hypothetical protein [Tenacibaculum haliotis]MCT4697621.1 hypothetical protein [Tenacibaculum haliotis]